MDDPKDGAADAQFDNPESSSRAQETADSAQETDDRARREEQVRRKLQQMFGDDSPKTVLHFLSDLAREDSEGSLPPVLQPGDLLDSEPN